VGSSARVLGLALSGGGHRAALFHIGVLARLAEFDCLRKVRVISTVSGGSIVGALYYLLLREQLQTNTDAQMTPDVYLNVVRTLDDAYRKAIATSFRGRALARPGIVRMVKPSFPGRTSSPRSSRNGFIARSLDRTSRCRCPSF
jgi:predicted acylesterase/phospholipase RssA